MISNHIASMDSFVYLTVGVYSFVAKDDVRKIPAIGIIAFCNQAIFNKRESKENRAKVAKHLENRIGNDYQT